MKRPLTCLAALAIVAASGIARAADASPPKSVPEPRIYYGGGIGFSFWDDYSRISIEPLIGYKFTSKFSVGGRLRYEHVSDDRGDEDFSYDVYGASVFTRYRFVPSLYGHAELAYMSYDYPFGREEVPFLLLGGGYSQPIGKRSWGYVEVLVDVLQDDDSPYDDWEPTISAGIGVGF